MLGRFLIWVLLFSIQGREVTKLERMIQTEAAVVKALESYLEIEENRLQQIRRLRDDFSRILQAALNQSDFLENPLNTYLLVKKLTSDWSQTDDLINKLPRQNAIESRAQHLEGHTFPNYDDLKKASLTLVRLQDTYDLDPSAMVKGYINGSQPSQPLSAGDCFELGRQAYNAGDFQHAHQWMAEALKQWYLEEAKTVNKEDILDYYSFVSYKIDDLQLAADLATELYSLAPTHPRAAEYKNYFANLLSGIRNKSAEEYYHPASLTDGLGEYRRLCRGEILTPEEKLKDLFCTYETNKHPYLILQPVKREELSLSPLIVMYHHVFSDREINQLLEIGKPKLERSTVAGHNKSVEYIEYRDSHSAYLYDYESKFLLKLNHRIEQITGLVLERGEHHQVATYGVGGHYLPHYDFEEQEARPGAINDTFMGNRIATWLSYLSDVKSGGATVFPNIGVSTWPRKGSAAFWYNMLRNGEVDQRTLHSGCPVISGSKWIGNKWIREREQLYARPCSTSKDI